MKVNQIGIAKTMTKTKMKSLAVLHAVSPFSLIKFKFNYR